MASLHQRPFAAAGVGLVFCTQGGMPGRAVGVEAPRKQFSSNQIYVNIKIKSKKKQYSESTVFSKSNYLVLKMSSWQRAASAAQRRLGEPKAWPDASLPRSETNRQFLSASRIIFIGIVYLIWRICQRSTQLQYSTFQPRGKFFDFVYFFFDTQEV